METNHTQGNWHAHDGQIYPEQTGATVALIPYFDKDNAEHQANSKLIAAAPDMLEALKIAKQWLEDFSNEKQPYKEIPAADISTIIYEAIYKAL